MASCNESSGDAAKERPPGPTNALGTIEAQSVGSGLHPPPMARGPRIDSLPLGTPPSFATPSPAELERARKERESRRVLSVTRVVTEIIVRVIMGDPSDRYGKVVQDVVPPNALVTLSPKGRLNAGTSFPLARNIPIVQEALNCNNSWVEVSWLQEYDNRWTHSVRVCCEARIDTTDPLQIGRSAQFNFLYFFDRNMPKLKTCLIVYEEEFGTMSPVSLLCAKSLA